MKRLNFTTTMAVPAATVWHHITNPESYPRWTSAFCEGSYFEGSWAQGQRIRFLSPGGEGMLSEIAENREAEYLSIRHLGMVTGNGEDTTSDAVRAWAPAYENYRLTAEAGGTRMQVDLDVAPEWEAFMTTAWPQALARLKQLCEGGA